MSLTPDQKIRIIYDVTGAFVCLDIITLEEWRELDHLPFRHDFYGDIRGSDEP